jgi:hypothetical protein
MESYNNLADLLEEVALTSKKKPIPIKEILGKLERSGFSLITLILVLPFMQPFPVGPISVLGGMTFSMIGWQMWKGYSQPALHSKILNMQLGFKVWDRIAKTFLIIIRWFNKISRARLPFLVMGQRGQKIEGGIFIIGGILMAIPFGILPFNNFFPGLGILFATLAQFEKDGLFILAAIFWLFFSILYFSVFFISIYWLGFQGLQNFTSGMV